ncbi:growth-regulating factor 7-like [Olea europaea var. sylvestris]|uniref:growth-regulating factor 7-like n=1 Tax=Olea europaea var. sylvestris TaxID=158386 RepID=UPI000C1CD7FE|nr:growth-regulating factor 7-like [Olea europaea var. sylvestris]
MEISGGSVHEIIMCGLVKPGRKYGNELAANKGYPFTSAQRKELERQAMIYNYMMASMPMPPDLPFHAQSNLSISLFECSDWSSRKVQATDGEKWRCSRDVPHDKYCECQKRPSCSRKPVEIKNNATGNNEKKSPLLFNPKTDLYFYILR